jgi:hypothetical protein
MTREGRGKERAALLRHARDLGRARFMDDRRDYLLMLAAVSFRRNCGMVPRDLLL